MAEEKQNIAPQEVEKTVDDAEAAKTLDFSAAAAVGNGDWTPEPWYVAMGNGILNFLVKIGLWLLGFLLDILKTLVQIVAGFFFGIYKICLGLFKGVRKYVRMFREMDVWGRLSFLVQGIGPAKSGQIVDGVVFFLVEVAFALFMVFIGGGSIANLFNLNPAKGTPGYPRLGDSHLRLIYGILAIFVCIGYLIVYLKGIKAAYDDYNIIHGQDFGNARENALYVFHHRDEFPEIDFQKASAHKIYVAMRRQYGFDRLSALYISYAPWHRLKEKENKVLAAYDSFIAKIYTKYCAWREKIKAGRWATAFSDFLQWKLIPRKKTSGEDYVRNWLEIDSLRFHHTFDKYNDYYAITRDARARLKVYGDIDEFFKCAFAEDKVSVQNGDAPLPHDQKIKMKEALSRIVGDFDVSFEIARDMAKVITKAVNSNLGNDEAIKEALSLEGEKEQAGYDEFTRLYRIELAQEGAGLSKVYKDYSANLEYFERGKQAFFDHIKEAYGIKAYYGEWVYADYLLAHGLSEEEASSLMALRAKRIESLGSLMQERPFHGRTLVFKKQAKQFTDEKFATTVLALPTIGAIATCMLPLVFSILIAFTNWDSGHTNNRFDWNFDAWGNVFGMGGSGFMTVFGTLLRWTLIWAVFATFTNYIGGIVLALIINKKGIKFKGFWRTCFVITIAIPQFITLLVIARLFDADGPLNTILSDTFGWKIPFLGRIVNGTPLFELDSNYTFIKMMIIILNMWVGVPYTMLSTSGILMNIPDDLYESAQIDGASAWTRFWKITVPYILFVTGPSLLTTFIGNINNFNVIYFLSGGGPNAIDAPELAQFNAGHTDILITWLYKLTVDKTLPERAMGSVIGCLMFMVCGFFSMVMYGRMGSVKNEEEFQ